jgi:hypothetical protein
MNRHVRAPFDKSPLSRDIHCITGIDTAAFVCDTSLSRHICVTVFTCV